MAVLVLSSRLNDPVATARGSDTTISQSRPQISDGAREMPTPSSNIGNPKRLLIHFGPLQSPVRKLGLF